MTTPPEDAYGRVTDPRRYAPLHPAARALLDRLEREYAVDRTESSEPDPHGERAPVVRLTPADPAAAPLTIVCTAFPGLLVRIGPTGTGGTALPHCGCDACDEQLPELVGELERLAAAVTAGTVGERLVRADGAWWHETWFRAATDSWGGRARLDDDQLAALRAVLPDGERTWAPWPRR